MAAAIAAGWPPRAAFEAPLQLLLHGVTVFEAVAAFKFCESWLQ
jgi:hypothetical protein